MKKLFFGFLFLIASLTTFSQVTGKLGYWTFDDSTSKDISGYGNNGTDVTGGSAFKVVAGIKKTAYYFNGSQYVDLGSNYPLNFGVKKNFSVSLWYRSPSGDTSYGKERGIFGKVYGTSQYTDYYMMVHNTSSSNYYGKIVWGTGQSIDSASWSNCNEPKIGLWHHLVGTIKYNSSTKYYEKKIFVDNVLKKYVKNSSIRADSNTYSAYIGNCVATSGSYYFKGEIDEVTLYNHDLSDAEVHKLYEFYTPKVTSLSSLTCVPSGTSITLNSNIKYNRIIWNTGDTSVNITVTKSGEYFYTVIGDKDSNVSNKVKVGFQTKKASITINKPMAACLNAPLNLSANYLTSDSIVKFLWLTDSSGSQLGSKVSFTFKSLGYKIIKLVTTSYYGCNDTLRDILTIKTTSKPRIITTTNKAFCQGDSILLYAAAGTKYRWNTKDSTKLIVVKNSGSFYVTNLDANGCKDSSDTVIITVNPTSFSPDFTSNTTSLSSKPYKVLFINNTSSLYKYNFNWSFGDGGKSTSTDPIYTYSNPGTYSVGLVVTNKSTGCKDSILKKNYISITTSIKTQSEKLSQVLVYPNPISTEVNINLLPKSNISCIIELVSLSGQLITLDKNIKLIENQLFKVNIQTNSIGSGIYNLNIKSTTGELLYSTQLIKN